MNAGASAIQGKKLSGERIANLEKMSECPALGKSIQKLIYGKFMKRSKDMEGDHFRSMAILFTEYTEIFQKGSNRRDR